MLIDYYYCCCCYYYYYYYYYYYPVNQVIAEALLSISPEESDKTFAKMYLPIVTEGNMRVWYPYRAYLPTPSYFAFHRNVARLNDYVTSLITKR